MLKITSYQQFQAFCCFFVTEYESYFDFHNKEFQSKIVFRVHSHEHIFSECMFGIQFALQNS